MNGVPFTWDFPYASRRMPVLAANVVATSQPLAAQAGLQMLQRGGNAVDAALAAAITLTVVEPTMNGIGSDAFAIVWDGAQLHGLNASGRSPQAWSPARYAGMETMPQRGWGAVTVPGAVSAWVALWRRFGRLPFAELFAPAIHYAERGFFVAPVTAQSWRRAPQLFAAFPEFAEAFLPGGQAPLAGQRFACPGQGRTLELVARTEGEAFYRGELAERICAHAAAKGGLLQPADLADHRPDWVGTLSQDYRGYTLHEIPPNGQGLAALIALGILQHWEMPVYPVDSADSVHLQLEAMKLALADARRYVADPESMEFSAQRLLAPGYLAGRAAQIDLVRAQEPNWGDPEHGDTVYLSAADAQGMMVSFIQSNYMGFGSGIVVPDTGISLQNRGAGFSLDPGHPNCVGGGKRPFHTIIPGFLTREGRPVLSFGVMGGPMQAQGHVQMVVRLADYRQNPQAATDAPRWQVLQGLEVAVEAGFRPEVIEKLHRRGHQIRQAPPAQFGGAQLVWKLEGGGYCAASEPRKDGQAAGW